MKLFKLGIAALALTSAGAIAATHSTSANSADTSQVSQVQQMLLDKGYSVGTVDGQMGAKTKSALKQFQQSQGLQASGQLDTQTLAALGTASTISSTSSPMPSSQEMPKDSSSQPGTPGFSPQAAPTPGMSTTGKTPG